MLIKTLGRVEEVQHARAPLVGFLRPRAVAHARQEEELGARRALGEPRRERRVDDGVDVAVEHEVPLLREPRAVREGGQGARLLAADRGRGAAGPGVPPAPLTLLLQRTHKQNTSLLLFA